MKTSPRWHGHRWEGRASWWWGWQNQLVVAWGQGGLLTWELIIVLITSNKKSPKGKQRDHNWKHVIAINQAFKIMMKPCSRIPSKHNQLGPVVLHMVSSVSEALRSNKRSWLMTTSSEKAFFSAQSSSSKKGHMIYRQNRPNQRTKHSEPELLLRRLQKLVLEQSCPNWPLKEEGYT